MTAPVCKRKDCGETVNPNTWPGDEGYCSALHKAFDAIENEPSPDPIQREREAFAKHLRSKEFLVSGLGLLLGEKP